MVDDSFEQLKPGQLIADRYRIEEPIGQGAMGAVWRAVHVRLESPVAIKLLKSSIADDPEMLERFLREARSAAAVRSSHVVQIFDYGVDRDIPYIAMELLVGEPLDLRLAARGLIEAPGLDKIFTEVARAVRNAHDLGVVHRDIKPANIFIAREGDHEVTKVLDFGIAKLVDQGLDAPVGKGTHTGIILGTPNYMSPEQARGQRQLDHRTDLWSLAVLAFECLTGRQPFESATLGDLVVKICTAQPLLPSAVAQVPAAFDAWFLRGVSKEPEGRFRSATEMADELHALLDAEGLGAESRPRSSTDRRFPPERLGHVSRTTRRGPSSPPPRDPSAHPRPEPSYPGEDGALGSESFPRTITEPSLTNTGAVSTEVLHPAAHARRRRGLALTALLLVVAGAVLALGPGRALFRPAPAADEVTSAGVVGAPSARAAAAAEAAREPARSEASSTVASPAAGALSAGAAAPSEPSRTAAPAASAAPLPMAEATPSPVAAPPAPASALPASERQRPSRPAPDKRAAKVRAPSTANAPRQPPATSVPFDPYSDRL
jgi:eukaryotic-like serine/threonine-protein kinase